MKNSSCLKQLRAALLFVFGLFASPSDAATAAVASRNADLDGAQIHYLTAGKGPAVLLLHGYTQTSRMCPCR